MSEPGLSFVRLTLTATVFRLAAPFPKGALCTTPLFGASFLIGFGAIARKVSASLNMVRSIYVIASIARLVVAHRSTRARA